MFLKLQLITCLFTCVLVGIGCDSQKSASVITKSKPAKPIRNFITKLKLNQTPLGTVYFTITETPQEKIDFETSALVLRLRSDLEEVQVIGISKEDLLAGTTKVLKLQPRDDYNVVLETGTEAKENVIHYCPQYFFEVKGTVKTNSNIVRGVDLSRLNLPEKLGKFCSSNNSGAALSVSKNPDYILQTAKEYESMNQHLGYYCVELPEIKSECAAAFARDGRTEDAITTLQEIRDRGCLFENKLRTSHFDSIRESDAFKELVRFAENESDAHAVGSVSIVRTPYCHLSDLLSIKTNPPLPASDEFLGKAVVVLVGKTISDSGRGMSPNIRLAKELEKTDVKTIAILNEAPQENFPMISIHIAEMPTEELLIGGIDIAWFTNKKGEVVHVNRSDIYSHLPNEILVAQYLNTQE